MNEFTIEELKLAHLESFRAMHKKQIVDVNGSLYLEQMFRRINWGWLVADGYRNTARFAWCGAGIAVAGLDLGEHLVPDQCVPAFLDPGICEFVLPSTRRLQRQSRWDAAGVPMATLHSLQWEANPKVVLTPGTVATGCFRNLKGAHRVYNDERDRVGGHFAMVEKLRLEEGRVDTIEANAFGELGDGSWGEGVVQRRGDKARHIEDFRFAVEWDDSHFEVMYA